MALSKNSKILVSDITGAIKSITRSGTTFTYTTLGGSTGTFTQQDNNTTYTAGTGISISSNKITNTGVTSVNGGTGAVTISTTSYPSIANAVLNGNVIYAPSGGTWWCVVTYSSYEGNGDNGPSGTTSRTCAGGSVIFSYDSVYMGWNFCIRIA